MPNHKVIPLDSRPADDGAIDGTAIDYALRGWASHAAKLTARELRVAIRTGVTKRGMSSNQLAGLLLLHKRQVDRFRYDNGPTEEEIAEQPEEAADDLALVAA